MGRLGRVIGLVTAVLCLTLGAATPARAASTGGFTQWGYIRMADGVQLRYTVVRPTEQGRYPTALVYDPYGDGSGPLSALGGNPRLAQAMLAHGYAVLGVDIRGSGCSRGTFNLLAPSMGTDGAAVVEWAAAQPWSTGHVGMFGFSYPGISQLGVVAHAPPHLDAIAPWQVVTDPYRDTAYPGGIFNVVFGAFVGFALLPDYSLGASALGIAQGDPHCVLTPAEQQARNAPYNPSVVAVQHRFDDAWFAQRRLQDGLGKVHIPALGCGTWQDDELSGRGSWNLAATLPAATTWSLFANGYHGECEDPVFSAYLVRFFDRYLKGVHNGFESTPHVTVLHDEHPVSGNVFVPEDLNDAESRPAWVSTHPTWPVAVNATHLRLASSGLLSTATTTSGRDWYVYPSSSPSDENGLDLGQANMGWKVPDGKRGAVTYTTPRLGRDAEFFGPGSVNLWVESTATDTDVQVTLSEVRPDGAEVYVQRGWLRASHRALDTARSTELRPVETHQQRDARPLVRRQPTLLRIEMTPFDYVFRAGSSIRLTIDAPTGTEGLLGHLDTPRPAINTILHDAAHPSEVVLGLVPGGRALAGYPKCNTVLNQPCRPNIIPVPKGRLAL